MTPVIIWKTRIDIEMRGNEQSTTRGLWRRERASCVARTWIALSVERMCAPCPGSAPNEPFVSGVKWFVRGGHGRESGRSDVKL
jgi:hypothetical protein